MNVFAQLSIAIDALGREGYDTHETASGRVYIAGLAPDSSDEEYGGNTEPGSAWDEECDARAETVRAIVAPYGCDVSWDDDDLVISLAN